MTTLRQIQTKRRSEERFPNEFMYNPKPNLPLPDFGGDRLDSSLFTKPKIYVTEKDYFSVNFEDIFDNNYYIINFTCKTDVTNWNTNPMKFYQCQLNFAVACATTFCGISRYHLLGKFPELVKSVIRFHVYFTVRKILSYIGCPLPRNSKFLPKNNLINFEKLDEIKRRYNIPNSYDFRCLIGKSNGMGKVFIDSRNTKNYSIESNYGESSLVFWDNPPNHINHVNHIYNEEAKNGYSFFIPENVFGLNKNGISSLNESIRNYIILILGSQVETRSPIIGSKGLSFDAQKEFMSRFTTNIDQAKSTMTSKQITTFEKYVTQAKIHLNYVIGPNLYLISDNLVMDLSIKNGYNNQLIVGSRNQHFGINSINLNEIKKSPLMDGKPSVTKRLPAIDQPIKIKNKVAPPQPTSNSQPSSSTHDNIKLTLFFITSIIGGIIFYFK